MSKLIDTNESKCIGCNKCIMKCPVHANLARLTDGQNKIEVNNDMCISCGGCIDICEHNARTLIDDTDMFFSALNRGERISVVVAPAAKHNFAQLEKLLGYLKKRGVNLIYDVSYGADITTWAYIKAIQERSLSSIISQPCPVIVDYIQKYKPALIDKLAPIHSPAMCTAIYLKKYQNVSDKIAFLSPCVGKKSEFEDKNTNGVISYNVTYKGLSLYLEKQNVNLFTEPSASFDNINGSLGFTFSRPGGLLENVRFYLGDDVWIRQVEGIEHVTEYLDEYEKRIALGRPVPLLVDALNCIHGCNLGTGTSGNLDIDDIDIKMNSMKRRVSKQQGEECFSYFDSSLNLNDFVRTYDNKTDLIPKDQSHAIEQVFMDIGKETDEDRHRDCFCCGYGSCEKFALAVANGQNHVENCVQYSQKILNRSVVEFDTLFGELEKQLSRSNQSVDAFMASSSDLQEISTYTKLIALNARIESARAGSVGASFGVVASEMQSLAERSASTIGKNYEDAETVSKEIEKIAASLSQIKAELHRTMHII